MTEGRWDACLVGGAGHVGAPLAVVMATHGLRTLAYDIDKDALGTLARGEFPFMEHGAEELLRKALALRTIGFSSDISDVAGVPILIVTIGTPIDEFHNPMLRVVTQCMDELMPYLSDEQTIILRSTVFPGVTDHVHEHLRRHGKRRSSLSYKFKKLLRVRAREVLTTDPFVRRDGDLLPLEEVVERSDLLILCVPHTAYRGLDLRGKPVVDLWGVYGGPPIPEPKPVLLHESAPAGEAHLERRSAS